MGSFNVKVTWNGGRLKREVRKAAGNMLESTGVEAERALRRVTSRPGHGVPSRPYEPPHLQTGRLNQSAYHKTNRTKLSLEVGETADHAGYLEKGTTKMLPRPHIVVTTMRVFRRRLGR